MLLAARERGGAALEQRAEAEHRDDPVDFGLRRAGPREPAAVEQVLAHREMREEPALLEDVAQPPAMGGQGDACLGVEEDAALDGDAARMRGEKPGDGVDDRGLARSGAAEEHGETGRGLEGGVEIEAAEAVREADRERHAPAIRRVARRASTSESTRAATATKIEISTSGSAPDSPPGTWRRA